MKFCETCVYRKSCRVKFGTGILRTKGTLNYIHSDLWGSARTQSLSGATYFMSIVDDYSRKLWICILKNKNDAFSHFKQWKTKVEKQTGRMVKRLRTDNGLEFCSEEFKSYCKMRALLDTRILLGLHNQMNLQRGLIGLCWKEPDAC